jgi:nicotinamidase-related amidase
MDIQLLVIDPQHDFCNPQGALYVGGAEGDMSRLGAMVDRLRGKLDDIHVTLDSHRLIDISHPAWFVDDQGHNPDPFTIMSLDNGEIIGTLTNPANGETVYQRKFRTKAPGFQKDTVKYLEALTVGQRYPHCIWPPHCLIGSMGHTIVPQLYGPLQSWEEQEFAQVDYITKGSNPFTEHFSGVQAEVPDPHDPSTQINVGLIDTLEKADIILVAGEASSHCLANTMRDIAKQFDANGNGDFVKKVTYLTDAASPVGGFEQFETDFLAELRALGMQDDTTTTFLA